MAMVAAGFVVGRGPLAAPRAAPAVPAAAASNGHGPPPPPPAPVEAPVLVAAGAGAAPPPPPHVTAKLPLTTLPPPPPAEELPRPARRLPPFVTRSLRPLFAALVLAGTLLCAWAIWQPLRSDNESDHALDLSANNHVDAARSAAQRAHEIDPLTPRPYVVRNAIEDASANPVAAQKALQDAVIAFPADPQTWIQLAQYQLNSANQPAEALKTIKGALYLDPQSRAAQTVYFQASAELNGAPSPTAPPAPTGGIPTAPAPPLTPGGP
jgi:tetratricopeptide (TPR) repeat protein